MAITTYSELKTALANWSKRTDLSTVLGDFIASAEARIQRSLLARAQEVQTELTMVAGFRYVAIPADFDSPRALWLKANLPREELPQVLPEQLTGSNTSGYPEAWAIDGSNIAFDKPASNAWAFDFRYCKPLSLSDSTTTNYILGRGEAKVAVEHEGRLGHIDHELAAGTVVDLPARMVTFERQIGQLLESLAE